MATYHVKFRVWYAGGETDEFEDLITEEKFHWYSDGGKGGTRLNQMAEERDFKGRKVNMVTMATIKINY